MNMRWIATVCLCLVPVLLRADEAPRSVTAAYALLAKHNRVPDVLREVRGTWLIRESSEVAALSEPTVDRSNGYIRIGIRDGGCSESVTEVAMFVAGDGRRFAAVGTDEKCIDNDHTSAKFFALDRSAPVDATEKAGAYGTLTLLDFLDEDYLKDDDAREEARTLDYVGLVTYRIPRLGTTVRVTLRMPGSPLTGYPESEYRQALRIVDTHRKYDEIELKWSAREARFTIGKKSAISTHPLSAP